jgi:hypothetical protein
MAGFDSQRKPLFPYQIVDFLLGAESLGAVLGTDYPAIAAPKIAPKARNSS